MNEEELYKCWLAYRQDTTGFSDCRQAVRRAIAQHEPVPRSTRPFHRWLAWLEGSGDWTAWVFGLGLALLGFCRISAITMNLLIP
ncbi:hypothetical protein DesfrDRAFT_2764 [Solidesulfovibrio fructosivorans JJ]]|uniref:Uncharacterized protein n=1 Tax=Solidesulfovibrio fructosivorans JJ] TaxID=596151 RepID=E1JYR5_SOLFR|nr:hypothetical protein [Solidesulfovibrio fructosivorans]EFL50485.1 hypothetical protein DesfrDRAFT_2764 [Solidesulfovibrio fructosivorans JJ]]